MRRLQSGPLAVLTLVMAAIIATGTFGSGVASAATTVVVSPIQHQGWSTADTRPGGAVMFVNDPTSPFPSGALQLTTVNTTAAKAQYLHAANLPLSGVNDLSYYTKQNAGPIHADPSYQLLVELDGVVTPGDPTGFTTFVYEPYQKDGEGTVPTIVPGVWQSWDVDTGQFWSSRSFTDGTCSVSSGAGGPPFYSLAALKVACPNAVAIGFGVNIGSFNPGYDVYTDGVTFNETTYDFQYPVGPPTSKDECKNGGWESFDTPRAFKNQGDCNQFVNTGK